MRFQPLPCFVASLLLALAARAQPAPSAAVAPSPGRSPQVFVDPAPQAVNWPVPYEPATPAEIRAVLDRVLGYLETATPARVLDRDTQEPVADLSKPPARVQFASGSFLLSSYEWGVTYAGMFQAASSTGEPRYRDYAAARLLAVAAVAARTAEEPPSAAGAPRGVGPLLARGICRPRSLDDCGSMANAFILATRAGVDAAPLRPWIDAGLGWITDHQKRFADGTLARDRPHADTLWLDDLYMSVPALARMGAFTGERRYFDDAVRQILQFSERMFVPELGLYRHGWVRGMEPHPVFAWGRANGWAILAMAELLSELPEDHPGRAAVLKQFRAHAAGLARVQGSTGLWHQLLDRPDSYRETSASAMFVYAIARGINRGWLDPLAYGPVASLGWNAVAEQVNARGQVENTCVATGMGFDPAFYYHRPVSVFAAHGYGPVLLAGSEMILLRQGKGGAAARSDGSIQFAPAPAAN